MLARFCIVRSMYMVKVVSFAQCCLPVQYVPLEVFLLHSYLPYVLTYSQTPC
jgi:hypothetical protein